MFLQDCRITELSVDEYFYLTENMENVDSETMKNGVKYLVYNRRQRLIDIVKNVMECELTDFERSLSFDYWAEGMSVQELQEKYRISRPSVYRYLEKAKKKLQASLKYVWLYHKTDLPNSAEELLKYVKNTEN